jgi:8-oxo-dGTP diphosphatase
MPRLTPKATAGAIIHHPEEGKNIILLTKRNIQPFKDFWCLPGGHIEMNETARHAAIREVEEETGLQFEPEYLFYFDEIFPEMNLHNVVQMFYGPGYGQPIADPGEVNEIKWISIDNALDQNLAFTHGEVLLHYRDKILL